DPPMDRRCRVLDSLELARRLHPGQRNTLDALCKRYGIDNAQRTLHGALLDAEILADVYLAMTREQVTLSLEAEQAEERHAVLAVETNSRVSRQRPPLRVIRADGQECQAHERYLALLDSSVGGECRWRSLDFQAAGPELIQTR
ncbi:MAG: exonuclease domain-containing protein, partial [Candidatus Competibacteraceae bacterium]|nr:exonuclease domain-containing protein [Candidatus Competibacteraceae bacterium]